ncbi:MAG: heparan-alpha-glucosaminide N-acetyltransferase [Lachnospiraceae bacterium]|nr:heparan-alpha-glucosaminide N-acetyltransferase [Lachnospiraceae bacterium]
MNRKRYNTKRLHLLDVIRGITLISMIAYHAAWDLVYIAGVDWPFYHTEKAFLWQQSICWTFILLSGFCAALSVHRIKRGLLVSLCGVLVTAVTLVFLPEDRVIFGVLTLLGSAMLLCGILYKALIRMYPIPGMILCGYLFYLLRDVNSGWLQLYPGKTYPLPAALYHGYILTYLGFMDPGFMSTDYFSLLPWVFLFLCGFYLSLALQRDGSVRLGLFRLNIPPLSFLGRHSLLIYLLHQPVLYMVIVLWMQYLK